MLLKIKRKISSLGSELVYRLALLKHAANLPALEESDRQILDNLKCDGIHITTLTELGFDSTSELLKAAYSYLSQMTSVNNDYFNEKFPQIYTVTYLPEFATWGSEKRLLNIIENYIGLPIIFHGVHLRKDFPNKNQFGTQLWHKDAEDRRMIKIIIYLNDVEEKHGPFEYIPASLTSLLRLNYYRTYYKLWQSGHLGITDEELNEIIPKQAWKACMGLAGTVIIVDPKKAIHHGTFRTEDRLTLFSCYTSTSPERPEVCTQYRDNTFPQPKLAPYSSVEAS
ncbi:MAG: phytanoyl-CoA dioxygenase [Nostoc sp.]|uniref:phytanoyl-CoA dioxygenase n=1 Tax=Nostoc sp. TaxID=1180 RepID=UPI002FFC185C